MLARKSRTASTAGLRRAEAHLKESRVAVADAGLDGLRVWNSDKATVLAPPYADPEAQATVAEAKDERRRGIWLWDPEETRRYFVAGGGEERAFDAEYSRGLAAAGRVVEAYERGTEFGVGAGFFLLASGRKGS